MNHSLKLLFLSCMTIMLVACGDAAVVDPTGFVNTNNSGVTPDSIAITTSSATMGVGTAQSGTATGTYSDGSTSNVTSGVTWSSSDPSVATVSANGVITGVSTGTAVITGTLNGVSNTISVQVLGASSITAIANSSVIIAGSTGSVAVTATFSDSSSAAVTSAASYSSSDPSVVIVSPTGVITAVGPGTAVITVTFDGVTTTIPITVNPSSSSAMLTSITVLPPTTTIFNDGTVQMTATGNYSDSSNANLTASVVWSSSNPGVATVNNSGLVSGVTAGSVTITATQNGVTSTSVIDVVGVSSLAIVPGSLTVVAGGATSNLVANAVYTDTTGANVTSTSTWSSNNTSVATVSSTGVVTGLSAGSAIVTVTHKGVSNSIIVTVTSGVVLSSIAVTPANASINTGMTQQYSAIGTYSDASTSALTNETWSVSDTNIATIDSNGLLTAITAGVVTVTASEVGINGMTNVTITVAGGPAAPGLQFSEIGSGNTGSGFWLELYNTTASPIDLATYALKSRSVDALGEVTHPTFALPSKVVPAGGYLVVMTDDIAGYTDVIAYAGNPNVVILAGANYSWQGSGYVELLDAGSTADFVRFGSNTEAPTTASEWTGGAASSFTTLNYGESLARDATNTDTDGSADWTLNSFASMGGPNDITCAVDSDTDGIPDCSEVAGSTYGGLDLYAMGARTNQKDLFVEIDHMDPAGRPGEDTLGMVPQREALDMVKAAFLAENIHVHFDVGDLLDQNPGIDPLDYDLGGGDVVPFAEEIEVSEFTSTPSATAADLLEYKAQYVSLERRSIFYYIVFAYSQIPYNAASPRGSSGISELNGNDTMVTMGSWGLNRANATNTNELINKQAGTLMHEFGHALGLHHGGAITDSENYKPNYLSVMNYLYQFNGLPTLGAGGNEGDRYYSWWSGDPCYVAPTGYVNGPFDDFNNFKIGFSDGTSLDLDEVNGLNEAQGLGRPTSAPVDWNCDGDTDDIVTNWDTNNGIRDTVKDHDDWGNIQYFFAVNGGNRIANGASENGIPQRLDVFVGNDWRQHQGFIREPSYADLLQQ